MPLNVRKFYSSLLLIFIGIFASANAQTVPPATTTATTQPSPAPQVKTPTAGEIMRDRISKAKALIAIRNYSAANYELESIRRESNDASVLSGVSVLLMNSYLEQGDYRRAQDFLNQAFNIQKTTAPNGAANYFTVAGQVVKGARNRVERYRALGLNVSDRTLPLEAINDLEKMRETLELVVTQSKEISKDKAKSPDAMALLEEASTSRSMIARDDYDARRWRDQIGDAREDLASSRSVVLSAVTETPANSTLPQAQNASADTPQNSVIANTSFKESAPVLNQNKSSDAANKTADNTLSIVKTVMQQPVNQEAVPRYVPDPEPTRRRVADNQPAGESSISNKPDASPASETATGSGPLEVGSLLAYATKQSQPVYPVVAKSMRTTGVVKVEVTVDEQGNVADVQSASGPPMLQAAAKDAIRKWRFRPFVRDGQPVRATGFVSFNFAL